MSSTQCTLVAGGEVIRSQHHQPSGSNWLGVYRLVSSMQLTSPTWWGFQYLQNRTKNMAQGIIYSPWGGTKASWLYLMTRLLLFCLAWVCSFLSACSPFSDQIYSLTKIFLQTKAGGGYGVGGVLFWRGPIGSFLVTFPMVGMSLG